MVTKNGAMIAPPPIPYIPPIKPTIRLSTMTARVFIAYVFSLKVYCSEWMVTFAFVILNSDMVPAFLSEFFVE